MNTTFPLGSSGARDLAVAGASVLFSMWVTFASGYQAIYQTLVAVLAGIVLYAFLNARRENLGQIPDPVDNPPGSAAQAPAGAGPEPGVSA